MMTDNAPTSSAGDKAPDATPAPEAMLTDIGFTDISIELKADSEEFIYDWDNERDLTDCVVAAMMESEKPAMETQP